MTAADWEGRVRAVLYPVIFSSNPLDDVDRVARDKTGSERMEIIRALREALASSAPLAGLLPQDHDEQTIRRYISALLARLEAGP